MKVRNIKLHLAYDGTCFDGWQAQGKKKRTVQKVVEEALWKVMKQKPKITAASRTDKGVHALGQVINFRVKTHLSSFSFREALNYHLPKDIVVQSLNFVPKKFHARYGAKGKHYRYKIHGGRIRPVMDMTTCWVPVALDVERMREASRLFVGKHNFLSFAMSPDKEKNNTRTIEKLQVKSRGKNVTIDVKGNGFLRHMVRIIVGTLVDVGRGKIEPKYISRIIQAKDRRKAGVTAKAHGLTLVKVYY